MRTGLLFAPLALVVCTLSAFAQPDLSLDHMTGTDTLVMGEPLDVVMVRGINYFAERELADSPNRRSAKWNRDYSSAEAYQKSIEPNRQRLREIIGAADERVTASSSDAALVSMLEQQVSSDDENARSVCNRVRWDVLPGVTAEGEEWFHIGFDRRAHVILVPDADRAPDSMFEKMPDRPKEQPTGLRFPEAGCTVLAPTLLSRSDEFSGHPDIRFTNQPHREFIYRMAFEMGRHIVGYEVQKILAAVDCLEATNQKFREDLPIIVVGIGEGGLVALYAAALDPRIDGVLVSGYFEKREAVWREPIYRNIWDQLTEFGDAEIASMIAPRPLVIEACAAPEVKGPPAPHDGRSGGAAPGQIVTAAVESVRSEFSRAQVHYAKLGVVDRIQLVVSENGAGPQCSGDAIKALLSYFDIRVESAWDDVNVSLNRDSAATQRRQVDELNRFTQRLMHSSDKARDKVWVRVDRTNVDTATASLNEYREWVYDTLIGRLPEPTVPLNPRTRKVIDEPTHVGYEVVLDLFPRGDRERPLPQADGSAVGAPPRAVDKDFFAVGDDWGVIAGGILLIPKDIQPGEQRPVVVCQHGLEGTPMSTIVTDPSIPDWNYYKGFATELCKRGFITYAPQNPYRGADAFRHIQRKSNPMGRSLFSYIIPQHKRTLEFLGSLPYVDPSRIAFYGLSYGGKTAVRVPPMLPMSRETRVESRENAANVPLDSQLSTLNSPGYCLSICSADFNEWVRKNASSEDRYSYVFTGEYEIFEWNMGHVANYAELSCLMTPRPFMVERGHGDGVAPDEWVAWEFAKVKRHYDLIGIGDKTEMEVFNGPHTINGVGTYDFLHRHLEWPKR